MRPVFTCLRLVPLVALSTAVAASCSANVPDDPGARNVQPGTPAGVIEGTVLYQGPRPCSSGGHIVGAALLLVFDRQNPPPPSGLGASVVNFGLVTGDALFVDEPRYTGSDVYCPQDHGFTEKITASAPFAVSPLPGGSYIVQSFYDYMGDFLPTFKFRELPERGDVGGGDVDTADALKEVNASNPNYQAHFLEVDVGTPEPLPADAGPSAAPIYDIPTSGYVADNVSVSIGVVLPTTRPYLYAQGLAVTLSSDDSHLSSDVAESSDVAYPSGGSGVGRTVETDPDYVPILTIAQDIQALAAPTEITPGNANLFESVLPHINLIFGVTAGELPVAAAPPFKFQLDTTPGDPQGAFSVWQNAAFDPTPTATSPEGTWNPVTIPEGTVPQLWPVVILSKLIDDPTHTLDPSSLAAQGSPGAPAVIIQGISLLSSPQPDPLAMPNGDTLLNTTLAGGLVGNDTLFTPGAGPGGAGMPVVYPQDHLSVALRPSVICFNHLFDGSYDNRGVLVTPFQFGTVAGSSSPGPIVPPDLLSNGDALHRAQVTGLVGSVQYGCLPTGRYAINVVYPDGQAWTVPNEAGACSTGEGTTDWADLTCTMQPRPVVRSQGPRAVVEIVAATNPANCLASTPSPAPVTDLTATVLPSGSPAPPVPTACQVTATPQ